MGQKVNPIGLRLGINRTSDSRWFANKGEYGKLLHEDFRIREALMVALKQSSSFPIVSSASFSNRASTIPEFASYVLRIAF